MFRKTTSLIALAILLTGTLATGLGPVASTSTKSTTTVESELLNPSLILLGGAAKGAGHEGTCALYVNWKDNYLAHHLTDGSTWGPWPQESEMDNWRFAVSYALKQYGFDVEFAGDIPEDLSSYDLLVLHAYWAVEPRHEPLIRNYVLAGGGVIILSGVPPYLVDYEKSWWTTTNLTPIHEWFGASSYVNVGGYATVTIDHPFGTELTVGSSLCSEVGYSNAAVSCLDNDTQIVARWCCGEPYAFSHEYGQGRVYYQARFEKMTTTYLPEHELAVSLDAPTFWKPAAPVMISGTVYNMGSNNETNIGLQLLINDLQVASAMVPEFSTGSFYMLSYIWTPLAEGLYTVTIHALPVANEENTENNIATKQVDVSNLPEGTVVYVEPQVASVAINESLNVNINIRSVSNLYGYEFKLFYSRRALNCTNIALPSDHFLTPQDPNFLFTIKFENDNEYNDTHGFIWVAMALLYPELPKTGNGALVTVTFQALAIGESTLKLSDTKLADSDGNPIAHIAADGLVIVEETLDVLMRVDINADRNVDIFDIVFVATAFSSKPGDLHWDSRADINKDEIVDIFDLVMATANYGRTY